MSPPHHQPANDAAMLKLRDALSMSLAIPEPEVLGAQLACVKCKSLAKLIVSLIAEHEPLLMADADGATVVVREVGGDGTMRFTVTSA